MIIGPSLELYCPNCGEKDMHKVLTVQISSGESGYGIRVVTQCSQCEHLGAKMIDGEKSEGFWLQFVPKK